MKAKPQKNRKSPLKKSKKSQKKAVENSKTKSSKVMIFVGILGMVGGGVALMLGFFLPSKTKMQIDFSRPTSEKTVDNNIYSSLTGMPLATVADKSAPTFCIQTPNGLDGARPQAGLNEAGVVFEAIAEAGITRFAAIYQNPTSAVIGPIRSLRTYYLEWDTPFDCMIVHAGGSADALRAVANGYKDLTENYSYMYRGSSGSRLWNNLFTTASYLKKASSDYGYDNSDIKGFDRMTPQESLISRVNSQAKSSLVIYEQSNGDTAILETKTPNIAINFGGLANFNLRYNYDLSSNSYLRSYADGTPHDVYNCPGEDLGEINPEGNCKLAQLAPSVVIAIEVQERRASDNYHEDITTVGSGDAYIFQNGIAIAGTWKKSSVAEQIKFYDASGAEIKLAPGQTFIEAVPGYGSVEY